MKSATGKRVSHISDIRQPGDFVVWTRSAEQKIFGIAFLLPGQKRPSEVLAHKVKDVLRAPQLGERCWNWDGNEDAPTLVPSIQIGKWHGYLLSGKFVAVPIGRPLVPA